MPMSHNYGLLMALIDGADRFYSPHTILIVTSSLPPKKKRKKRTKKNFKKIPKINQVVRGTSASCGFWR
jgi:hypothetical protein